MKKSILKNITNNLQSSTLYSSRNPFLAKPFKSFSTINSDDTITASTKSNLNIEDILPDHLDYKIPKYKKNSNFDFPWLIDGAPFLEIKSRFLPDQVFSRNKTLSRRDLLEHLFKIYRGVLLASSQNDLEFLSEYCEEQFLDKFSTKLKQFQDLNYSLEVVEDMKAQNNKRISPELHIYDSIIVKGLSVDRKANGSISDYSVCNDLDDMGFISYIHSSVTDGGNFLTKDAGEARLKDSKFQNLVFRAYCMFKCGLKLFIKDSAGNDIIKYSSDYNFNHACVFECEMNDLSPLKSYTKLETYTEWIGKHDFGIWKMVDMDNWMKGNDYFLENE